MRLFIERGYAETTLEMVAEEAGIARRTFFSYFKSKDEILLAQQHSGWDDLLDEVRKTAPGLAPLAAVRDTMVRVMGRIDDSHLRAIVRVKGCSSALVAARHASFAEREATLYSVLCEVWPEAERAAGLRLVAMVSIGTLRVAAEAWQAPGNGESLQTLLGRAFAGLEALR